MINNLWRRLFGHFRFFRRSSVEISAAKTIAFLNFHGSGIGLCAGGIGWLQGLNPTMILPRPRNGRRIWSGGAGRVNRPCVRNARPMPPLHSCRCDSRRRTCHRQNNSRPGGHIWRRSWMFICRREITGRRVPRGADRLASRRYPDRPAPRACPQICPRSGHASIEPHRPLERRPAAQRPSLD